MKKEITEKDIKNYASFLGKKSWKSKLKSCKGIKHMKEMARISAEKRRKLTEDKNNRERMSQNGWSFVREKFHYTRLVNDMEKYYLNLLEKTKK